MSTSTALGIITASLKKIGVGAEGETLSSETANDSFDVLNDLLDSWSGRSLLTTAQIRENFTLIAGQSLYTIGVGGNFNTSKPFEIVSAFVRDGNNIDYGIDVVSREIYDAYSDKALTTNLSRPTNLFYDPGVTQQAIQRGNVYLYPTPDSATTYTLFIESEKSFTNFTTLADVVTFPATYKRALVYNLAIELASEFGRSVTGEVRWIAGESMRIIENINSRNKVGVASLGLPGSQGVYNIYSDSND